MISSRTYVCWRCRNVRKVNDWYSTGSRCQHCRKPMADMGKRWKPPRKTQDRKWRIQQQRWENGLQANGKPPWGSFTTPCRWCGEPMSREHNHRVDQLRPPGWAQQNRWWKKRGGWKGEKK